jgi:hypothetical protein
MTFLKKASMALIAASMMAAPVAASAANAQFSGLTADTQVSNGLAQGEEGGDATSWILALFAAAAIIAGIVIAADGSNSNPTSP